MPTTAGPAPVVDRPGRVDRRPAPNAQEPPPSAQRRTGLRQALTLIVWLLLAGGLGLAAAEERLVAFWMTIDAGPKAVAMDVIAVTIGALVRTSVCRIKIAIGPKNSLGAVPSNWCDVCTFVARFQSNPA